MVNPPAIAATPADLARQNISFIALLRAIASLMVVWCQLVAGWNEHQHTHFGPLSLVRDSFTKPLAIIQDCGFFGVALFFFVSGFIITHVGQREGQLTFLVKRLFRIYPPLIVSIVIVGVLGALQQRMTGAWPPELKGLAIGDYLRSMTLWNFLCLKQNAVNVVAWTLVIEVMFYVLMLLLLPLMRWSPQAVTWLLAGLAWAIVLRSHDFPLPADPESHQLVFSSLAVVCGLLPLLLIGQATYWVWSGRARFWQFALMVAACYFVFACALGNMYVANYPQGNSYGVSVMYAYLLFVVAMLLNDRLRLPRVIAFYAKTSYSLYLLHLSVGTLALTILTPWVGYAWAIVPAFLIVTLASYLSWRFVEEPSQNAARKLLKSMHGLVRLPTLNRKYATGVAVAFVVLVFNVLFLGPPPAQSLHSFLLLSAAAAAAAPPPPGQAAPAPRATAANEPAQPVTLTTVTPATQPVSSETATGSLDLADKTIITGWAWDSALPRLPVIVSVYVDGAWAGCAPADRYRPDLAQARIGDGHHAYLIQSPQLLTDGRPHSVSVKVTGVERDLFGSPRPIQ